MRRYGRYERISWVNLFTIIPEFLAGFIILLASIQMLNIVGGYEHYSVWEFIFMFTLAIIVIEKAMGHMYRSTSDFFNLLVARWYEKHKAIIEDDDAESTSNEVKT